MVFLKVDFQKRILAGVILLLVSCLPLQVFSQKTEEKFTVSGTITDAETGETLIGVFVSVAKAELSPFASQTPTSPPKELRRKHGKVSENETSNRTTTNTKTNAYGFYSLTLPEGSHKIAYSFTDYKTVEKEINLTQNISLKIELPPTTLTLDEVVVTSEKRDRNVTSTEMSVERLNISQVEKIPVLMGEKDVLKTIQLMPGINTVSEGRSTFVVRGGTIDQNLILMDGAPTDILLGTHVWTVFHL